MQLHCELLYKMYDNSNEIYQIKCITILPTDLGGLQLDDEGQYEREVGDFHLYLYLYL